MVMSMYMYMENDGHPGEITLQ